MARAKGTGYVELIKNPKGEIVAYRARKTLAGQTRVGERRATRREAQRDLERLGGLEVMRRPAVDHTVCSYIDHELLMGRFARGSRAWSDATWNLNEVIWRRHLSPTDLGQMPLELVRRRHVQAFVDEWKGSATYCCRILDLLSKTFEEAIADELVGANPVRGIHRPRKRPKARRILTRDEAARILRPETRTEEILAVALLTGMRLSEVLALRWSDLAGNRFRAPELKSDEAWLPLSPDAAAILERQPKRAVTVFSTQSGNPIDRHNFARDWKARAEAIGLPSDITSHAMRRTFISLILESGGSPKTAQALARHKTSRMTMDVYAQTNLEETGAKAIRDFTRHIRKHTQKRTA